MSELEGFSCFSGQPAITIPVVRALSRALALNWLRNTLGAATPVIQLRADGPILIDAVDAADYVVWKSNFRQVAPAALVAGSTQPQC